MSDHECDWWLTPGGGYTCACGKSRRPIEETEKRAENMPENIPTPELSPAERAEVDRFGIHDDEAE